MAYTTIDDPSAHFQTTLYTGNGTDNHAITNGGNSDLATDLVWIKYRTAGVSHVLYDSSRGATKRLYPDFDGQEATQTAGVKSFDSDGFTLGTAGASNANNIPFVSWNWHANAGTKTTNTDGDINSTVQVNSDAGFSIVQYSPSNNTARSIGHGLGTTPQVVLTRALNRTENWRMFHSGAGSTGSLTLDTDAAYNSSTVLHTGVTSTTFGVGTDFSVNGAYNYVSWVFANKKGFSKHGKYTGNGSSDGVFVHTGFKPAFVMYKSTESGDGWFMFDAARNPTNVSTNQTLRADTSSAEGASKVIDFFSNGFKLMNSDSAHNGSGVSYIYMSFASNPFVTSNTGGSIPTTAF
tara:strand:- start:605 stop:1654 length:1050 start_codon:yes stop_codon:yes gene_type:complete